MTDSDTFRGTVRYFRADQASALAVVDLPPDVTARLGGLKQIRVRALVNGQPFVSNTMPGGGGRLALSLSRQIVTATGLHFGEQADFAVERLARERAPGEGLDTRAGWRYISRYDIS